MNEGESSRPTAAGIYDYFLGGTANTAADRAAAEQLKRLFPDAEQMAWANRGFLNRALKRLSGEYGVRQFLDLGAGMPTQRNTHQVVGDVMTGARVVYVDVDPEAVRRSRELLAGVLGTAAVRSDVRDVDFIINNPDTRAVLDFSQPVAVLMVGVTQFVPDGDDPWGMVRRYMDSVVSGSYLVLSAPTSDGLPERTIDEGRKVHDRTDNPLTLRSRREVARFFEGLAIMPPYPGAAAEVTHLGLWGAEDVEAADDDSARYGYVAVGRKP